MQLTNEFRVDIPVEQAWGVLTDLERVAPCMPGAELREIEGEDYRGVVKVKVGPVSAEYEGKAYFVERDGVGYRAVLRAEGRETKGQGNANATVTANLESDGEGATKVSVVTDLAVSGKAAQFGRGVLADVSEKLIGQFVTCLEATILGGDPPDSGVQPTQVDPATDIIPATEAGPTTEAIPATEAGPSTEAIPATEAGPGTGAASASEAIQPTEGDQALQEKGAGRETTPVPLAKPKRGRKPSVDAEASSSSGAGTEPGIGAPVDHNGVSQAASTASSNGNANGSAAGAGRKIAMAPVEPVDLWEVGGPSVAKRLIPGLIAALALALGGAFVLRRRRS